MKKLNLVVLFCVLVACSSSKVIEVEGSIINIKDEITTAKLKIEDDVIKEIELDESYKNTTKKTLGEQYKMREASVINKEWNEQVNFLEAYIEKNGIEAIQLDDEKKAVNEDIISGCTISIDSFLAAIEQAKANVVQE